MMVKNSKFHKYVKIKAYKKRGAVALIMTMVIAASGPMEMRVNATRSESEIKKEQKELQQELNGMDADLVSVVSNITELESEISDLNSQIAETQQNLDDATEAANEQYAAMKIRIKYTYENGNQDVFSVLLESGSISDFLDRLEYVNAVYKYDRDMLESLEAIKLEMQGMKESLEAQKAQVASAKGELDAQKSALQSQINAKKGQMNDLDTELAEAKEYAKKQLELQKQAQQAALAAANASVGSGTNTGASSSAGTVDNSQTMSGNDNPPSSGNGQAVVDYAMQFVGGPYVMGGNSLTNGIDCSGFVHQVYAHFGVPTPRYSLAFASSGQPVSYNNMQPGDVVVYAPKNGIGHVAIYAGGGKIVEAQSSKAGITCNRSVNCGREIIAIRRLI